MRELTIKFFDMNKQTDIDDKKQLLEYIKDERTHEFFLIIVSKLRTNNRFCREKHIIELVSEILLTILNAAQKNNNYSEFYKWVLSLPDCPFDLSREKFILSSDEPLILPESWNKYDSPYTYEIDGIPHKIFKLKIKDFDVFAEVQNFDESEKKRWICD